MSRDLKDVQDFFMKSLRLKTFPVAVKLCQDDSEMPERVRFPSSFLGKRITLCQGMTMARTYGWIVGMKKEDFQCIPAAIGFGFAEAEDPSEAIIELFCQVDFSKDRELGFKEVQTMSIAGKGAYQAIILSPLGKASFEPQVIVIYGNASQIMRISQGWSYETGCRISGHFGGKVECIEYIIGPVRHKEARIVIPGNGERIFAGTQDDELVCALPWKSLEALMDGIKKAGKAIGARYPIPPYQNFEPQFPSVYADMGKRFGMVLSK